MTATPASGSLTRVALQGAAFNVTVRLTSVAVSLGSLSILAHVLSPQDYGLFGVITLLVSLAAVIPDAIGNTVIQRKAMERREVSAALTMVVVTALVLTDVAFLSLDLVGRLFKGVDLRPYAPALYGLIPLVSLGTFFDAVQNKALKFKRVALIELFTQSIGQASVSIAFALAGYGAWSLVYGYIFATVSKLVVQLALGMLAYCRPARPDGEMLRATGWFVAVSAANYVGRSGDNFMVGGLLGATALGLYGRAYNLMMRPVSVIGGVVVSIFYPLISSIESDMRRLQVGYLRAVGLAALLSIPPAVFACAYGPEIIRLMLGDRWGAIIPAFQWFMGALYFRLAYRVTETLTFSRGALRGATLRQLFYGGAVLVGAALGARVAGVTGVAVGVTIALVLFFGLSATYANRLSQTPHRAFLAAHGPAVLIAAAVGVVVVPMRYALSPLIGPYPTLLAGAATSGAVFGGAVLFGPAALFRGSPMELLIGDARRKVLRLK